MHFKVNDLNLKIKILVYLWSRNVRSLIQGIYLSTSLALFVYNIDEKKSFERLDIWIKDIRAYTEDYYLFL